MSSHLARRLLDVPCRRDGKHAMLLVSLASALVMGALHDHACTGDGCLLCLVAGCAHVLLGVCVGSMVVQSLLHELVMVGLSGQTIPRVWCEVRLSQIMSTGVV